MSRRKGSRIRLKAARRRAKSATTKKQSRFKRDRAPQMAA